MATAVDGGRQDPSLLDMRGAPRDAASGSADWQLGLAQKMLEKIAMSDSQEEVRRKNDRIGANLYYGRHWSIVMPSIRSQLTANVSKSLVEHKVSIMTKQQPVPVVTAGEAGDAHAAQLMRQVLMWWWYQDGAQQKLRITQRLAETTRTCAAKIVWDPTLHGGAGNMTWDIIPGWRLILDDRARDPEAMDFIGHREIMRRPVAALYYPDAAKRIYAGMTGERRGAAPGTSFPASPLGSAYDRSLASSINFGSIVNGKPVISAFTNQPGRVAAKDDTVQIVELYHRDYTMYEDEEREYDAEGNVKMEIERDKEGIPLFDQMADDIQNVDGRIVAMPVFKLRMRERMVPTLKRVYPQWRRTTLLLPDATILDDRAHDGPAPFALFSAGYSLEGPWVKGPLLDLEDLQTTFNVSISAMCDNFRLNSMRAVLAGQASQLERNTLMIGPAEVIRVGKVDEVKMLEFPEVSPAWFQWTGFLISTMERIIGLSGIMQGEAAGRVDSAAGYDQLAEIGGSRVSDSTHSMTDSIERICEIAGWYAQRRYTDKHAIAVQDAEGNLTHERVSGPFLYGNFDYTIAVGSTMAWSESAQRGRLMQELQAGIIDKIEYWKRTDTPNWQQIRDRLLSQPPVLSGAGGAPPKRTRSSPQNAQKPPKQ